MEGHPCGLKPWYNIAVMFEGFQQGVLYWATLYQEAWAFRMVTIHSGLNRLKPPLYNQGGLTPTSSHGEVYNLHVDNQEGLTPTS